MTRYLLATASVHTTAAAADYLTPRLTADDEVTVLTVDEPALPERDPGDAANVARSRLVPATVEVVRREGDPTAEIRDVLAESDADALVIGPHRGDPDADDSLGSTARAVVEAADVPVVVVPLPDL